MWVFCKIDHCIHIHWCIFMGLGHNDPWVESHMYLNKRGVRGHLGVNDLWFKFLIKGSLYPHTLMYFHGTWTQLSLGRVTHVTSTDLGSKVILGSMTFGSILKKGYCIHILWHIFMGLGYNDPWVEIHMWPQQKWSQRSSWGHWPFLFFFK